MDQQTDTVSCATEKMKIVIIMAAIGIGMVGLWLTGRVSYLLFHSLAELFSILVAWGMFIIAWNFRRLIPHSFFLFFGVAFLAVGALDLLHLLSYKGMGVFPGATANLPTQLWIAARSVEAGSLLLAPLFLTRRVRAIKLLSVYILATALLLVLMFGGWFPACFVEGQGLTAFKVASEYLICLLLAGAIFFVYRRRQHLDPLVLRLVMAAMAVSIVSELSFTLYVDVYGLFNQVGHFLKIVAYALLYKAIIETGLQQPYRTLFRELAQINTELEARVQRRTAELSNAVDKLQKEILQRRQLEETLRESEKQIRFFASQCLTAQETERKRIAAELHDSIAASLAAIKYSIEKTQTEMEQGLAKPESLQGLITTVQQTIVETRRIMADLRPAILDDLGLIAAMNWLCREYLKPYSHIAVDCQIGLSEGDLPDSFKTPIFRISQEALNNIAKYSEADQVNLSLRKEGQEIQLAIQDNGRGFEMSKVVKGLGLSTMRERAELSGGTLAIESGKGGTTIWSSWPLG